MKKIHQGIQIDQWLQALEYDTYLTRVEKERIWKCLIDIANIYEFPVAPTIDIVSQPSTLIGGSTVINNYYTYNIGTPITNASVSGATDVDSFANNPTRAAIWLYTIRRASDQRSGVYQASWLSGGSTIATQHSTTFEIGDTSDVTLSTSSGAGNIILTATATTSGWTFEAVRILIPS
jgi:hypothetical protein